MENGALILKKKMKKKPEIPNQHIILMKINIFKCIYFKGMYLYMYVLCMNSSEIINAICRQSGDDLKFLFYSIQQQQ